MERAVVPQFGATPTDGSVKAELASAGGTAVKLNGTGFLPTARPIDSHELGYVPWYYLNSENPYGQDAAVRVTLDSDPVWHTGDSTQFRGQPPK